MARKKLVRRQIQKIDDKTIRRALRVLIHTKGILEELARRNPGPFPMPRTKEFRKAWAEGEAAGNELWARRNGFRSYAAMQRAQWEADANDMLRRNARR